MYSLCIRIHSCFIRVNIRANEYMPDFLKLNTFSSESFYYFFFTNIRAANTCPNLISENILLMNTNIFRANIRKMNRIFT